MIHLLTSNLTNLNSSGRIQQQNFSLAAGWDFLLPVSLLQTVAACKITGKQSCRKAALDTPTLDLPDWLEFDSGPAHLSMPVKLRDARQTK
ncbi:MAG: hypothetical protein ACKO7W_01985 [Elainella sp.]